MLERADILRDAQGFEMPDVHSSSVEYAHRFSGDIGFWLLSIQQSLTDELVPADCARIMEAGGGHGQNLDLWLKRFSDVTILGSQPSCAELISSKLDGGKLRFVVGPLTRIPFEDNFFDLSVSYRMLTHLIDWKRHIAELCRVSSATVLVEYPVDKGFNSLSSLFFSWKMNIEGNTRPYTLFEDEQIASEFRKHGFELNSRRAQFFWPMALHRLHKQPRLGNFLERLTKLVGLTRPFGSPIIARFDRKVK